MLVNGGDLQRPMSASLVTTDWKRINFVKFFEWDFMGRWKGYMDLELNSHIQDFG